ncbi:MAG TPA: hypothetical protein VJ961_06010 [Mariprofundaceae bacterium]|nr:hypothetical protein [Mariprofundaceae bacterium]
MADWINLLFDVVMLLAVSGMWLLWWRTSRKQRMIETMLLEASHELEVATSRLGESLEYIRRLKQESAVARPEPRGLDERVLVKRSIAPEAEYKQAKKESPPSGHITQMLRMRREGKEIDAIAEALNLPKAQVKLLLKLHAAGE